MEGVYDRQLTPGSLILVVLLYLVILRAAEDLFLFSSAPAARPIYRSFIAMSGTYDFDPPRFPKPTYRLIPSNGELAVA